MEKHTAQWPVNQRSQSRSGFPPSGANACAGAPTHPLPFSLVTSYRQAVTCLPLATYFFLQPSRCLACLKRSGKVLQVKPNPPISHRVCNFGVYCKIFFHSPHTAEQSPSPPPRVTNQALTPSGAWGGACWATGRRAPGPAGHRTPPGSRVAGIPGPRCNQTPPGSRRPQDPGPAAALPAPAPAALRRRRGPLGRASSQNATRPRFVRPPPLRGSSGPGRPRPLRWRSGGAGAAIGHRPLPFRVRRRRAPWSEEGRRRLRGRRLRGGRRRRRMAATTSATGSSRTATRSRRASWPAASSPSTTGASWCWGWPWTRVSASPLPRARHRSGAPGGSRGVCVVVGEVRVPRRCGLPRWPWAAGCQGGKGPVCGSGGENGEFPGRRWAFFFCPARRPFSGLFLLKIWEVLSLSGSLGPSSPRNVDCESYWKQR